jgi:tyrosyl-tRNA synthetase
MDEKKNLAESIVARYHGAGAAREAREYFERTIQRKERPADADIADVFLANPGQVADVIVAVGFAESKRAAQRLITDRAVRIDGDVVTEKGARWPDKDVCILQVGSRRFIRVHRGAHPT